MERLCAFEATDPGLFTNSHLFLCDFPSLLVQASPPCTRRSRRHPVLRLLLLKVMRWLCRRRINQVLFVSPSCHPLSFLEVEAICTDGHCNFRFARGDQAARWISQGGMVCRSQGCKLLRSGSALACLVSYLGLSGREGSGMDPELMLLSRSCVTFPIPRHLEQEKKKPLYASCRMARTCLAHWSWGISIRDCVKIYYLVLFIMIFN